MNNRYRLAEVYLYHYHSNMHRLHKTFEQLECEREHGDLKVQNYGHEVRNEGINHGAEDWRIKCEKLENRIIYLTGITAGITILHGHLTLSGRVQRNNEIMLGIMENVYFKGVRMREYISETGLSERTLYRRRYELVMLAAEYLNL